MKTYKETKEEVKKLVIRHGLDGIYNFHLTALYNAGHTVGYVQNSLSYFSYSPRAAKYRV